MTRALVIVLDSFGLRAASDAPRFGDVGADTFGHIGQCCAERGRPLRLPHLAALGLPQAAFAASGRWPQGVALDAAPHGAFGAAAESSRDKDTPSGHWELMGCPVEFDWRCFEKPADPAVPVSDRVFQVAAHETHFGLDRLHAICETAKTIFDEANIARVIARPFLGGEGRCRRTANRHDCLTPPPLPTLLDTLEGAGREVHGIGTIRGIFAARGIAHHRCGDGNADLCEETLAAWRACPEGGPVFANLVDFDMRCGHRCDVAGDADALEAFDAFLLRPRAELRAGDLLARSADHGCDPTWPGSDHTRECVPLLFAGPARPRGLTLGVRPSFADLGQTLASHLAVPVPALAHGEACW